MILITSIIFTISLLEVSIGEDVPNLIVTLNQPRSRIQGHALKSAKERTFYAFHEIPYGAAPVGDKRFTAPEFHGGWDGVLNTTQSTKKCYQFGHGPPKVEEDQVVESEDCLTLNIYTPVVPGSKDRLPVYLYVHGGSFIGGSSHEFGPKYLIDGDIIVVTINYRLGPLGFLSTEDNVVPGNMALKDQHLALQWTYKNIELFGGNPKDIVVGGQSAGAFAVSFQLLSPKNDGLLSGIIQQSGCALSANGYEPKPRQSAFALAKALNLPVTSDNTSSLVESLRQISMEQLKAATNQVPSSNYQGFMTQLAWTPFVEEENEQSFVTSLMHQDFIDGNFNHVPSMVGFDSEESVAFFSTEGTWVHDQAAAYDADPSLIIPDILSVGNRTLVGTKIRDLYTSTAFTTDLGAFVRLTTDSVFARSIIRQAELTSQYAPVYLYQFSAGTGPNPLYPGIPHGGEMKYLWDRPLYHDDDPDTKIMREVMLTLWWNFIKYKNPTPESIPTLQNIEWPLVDSKNIRYLNINDTLTVQSDPKNYSRVEEVLLDQIKAPYLIF